MTSDEALQIFKDAGALLDGHFKLHSGRHSRQFCQCAKALQQMPEVERFGSALADKFRHSEAETVVALAMGGLVIGQEIARQLGLRYIFAEKENGALKFRRGLQLEKEEKVIIVDDVVTRGGSLREIIHLVQKHSAEIVGIAVLVDRSEDNLEWPCSLKSLVKLPLETFAPDNLPDDLKGIQPIKPGS